MIRNMRWTLAAMMLVAVVIQATALPLHNIRGRVRSGVDVPSPPSLPPMPSLNVPETLEGGSPDFQDIPTMSNVPSFMPTPSSPSPSQPKPTVPPFRPYPPSDIHPVGPDSPSTRPVGPEIPDKPHIHPVGPERPNTRPVGPEIPPHDIHPVGPEIPEPHIRPVGPEVPTDIHPIGPEIPDPDIHPIGPEIPEHDIHPIGPEVPEPDIHPIGPEVPTDIHPIGPEVPDTDIHPVGPEVPTDIHPVGPEVPSEIHPIGPEIPTDIHPVGPEVPPHIRPVGPEVPPEIHPVGPEVPPHIVPVGPEVPSVEPQLGEGGEKLPPSAGGELNEDRPDRPTGFANLVDSIRSHVQRRPKARVPGYVGAWREAHRNEREGRKGHHGRPHEQEGDTEPADPLPNPPPQGGPAIPPHHGRHYPYPPPPSNSGFVPPRPPTDPVIDYVDGGEAVNVDLPADEDTAVRMDESWEEGNMGEDPAPPPPEHHRHRHKKGVPVLLVVAGAALLILTTACWCIQRHKVKRVTAERDALRLQLQNQGQVPQQVYAVPIRMAPEPQLASPSHSQQPYVALPASAHRVAQPYQPVPVSQQQTGFTAVGPAHGYAYPSLQYTRLPQQQEVGMQMPVQ